MFISLLYGDSSTILLNPTCAAKNFMDFVKEKCALDKNAMIDFCDEHGQLANISEKGKVESVSSCVKHRMTYIPVRLEKDSTGKLNKVTPLLMNWEKLFPSLEHQLKLLVTGGDKEKMRNKSPNQIERARKKEKPRAASRLESKDKVGSVVDVTTKTSASRTSNRHKPRKV